MATDLTIDLGLPRVNYRRVSPGQAVRLRVCVPGRPPRVPVDLTGRAAHVVLGDGAPLALVGGADGYLSFTAPALPRGAETLTWWLADSVGGTPRPIVTGVISGAG